MVLAHSALPLQSPGQPRGWQDGPVANDSTDTSFRVDNRLDLEGNQRGRTGILTTPHGTIAISICYDSEFPLIARRQVEQIGDLVKEYPYLDFAGEVSGFEGR